jgi:hypothetical protein
VGQMFRKSVDNNVHQGNVFRKINWYN